MSDNANPQQLITRGLLKIMKPVQALVMVAVYQQFPERFIPRNDYYFPISVIQIMRALKIKEAVCQLMVSQLVDTGFLERRKAKRGGMEYRIVFSKLHPFVIGEQESPFYTKIKDKK